MKPLAEDAFVVGSSAITADKSEHKSRASRQRARYHTQRGCPRQLKTEQEPPVDNGMTRLEPNWLGGRGRMWSDNWDVLIFKYSTIHVLVQSKDDFLTERSIGVMLLAVL